MRLAKYMYICLVIAIVHCDNTTPSYKGTSTNLINSSSTVNNGTGEKFDENSRVSKKFNDINSNNLTAHTLIDGKPKYFRVQIEVPYRSETKTNNNSQHYVLLGQRRAVLIINRRMSRMSYGKKGDKPSKAESLLYEEYNDDGKKVYSFAMSSLDDVAKFFQYYLNTHICHGRCDILPTTASLPPPEPLSEK